MLLAQTTPISLSIFLVILNIPLFLYGLKKQGKRFTIYSIYTVSVYSVCAWLITDVLPIDVKFASPLAGTDLLLCALFGGAISGIGSGLAIKSWILPLYSIVTYAAALKTVDFIVEGFDRAKCAMIITTKGDEVCEELSTQFESGMTQLDARGFYSNSSRTMIYFIINRFQVIRLKEIVHDIDPKAYITISEVADVFAANQDNN